MSILKPSQLAASLEFLVRAQQPTLIWGPPGVGKTEIVGQVASRLSFDLIDPHITTCDPVDLRGLPSISEGMTRWNIPAWFPLKGRVKGPGILFLDEIGGAPAATQVACLQLLLTGKLGDASMDPSWVCIGASNRAGDGAYQLKMSSALGKRFAQLEVATDMEDWCRWAFSSGIDPLDVAFIRFRNELLYDGDSGDSKTYKPSPNPRSWTKAFRLMTLDPPAETASAIVAGLVGEAAAGQYYNFRRLHKDLPDLQQIKKNPKKVKVPEDSGIRYATAYAIAGAADPAEPEAWKNFLIYLDMMPPEYSVLAFMTATQNKPKLLTGECGPASQRWANSHKDVLIA